MHRDVGSATVGVARRVIGGVGMSTRRKRKLVLQQFDINMAVFSKSWKVGAPLENDIRTKPLHILTVQDLHKLRSIIRGGWGVEIQGRNVSPKSPNVWLTPAMRS